MSQLDHDHQLRALLKAHLGARVGEGDRLVDEFTLAYGEVRADVALINGSLEGFEIKAGKDTLTRLASQVDAYGRVFDYSWVVTTATHLAGVRTVVPREWGLLVASPSPDGARLRQVRQAKANRRHDAQHLVRLLWREEVLAKLDALGLSKGIKSKPKIVLYGALAQALPVKDLSDYVRTCLKSREAWRVDEAPRVDDGSSHHDAIETRCPA